MITSVVFKISEKTKNEAMRRAKKEGITLSAFLKSATNDYAAGNLKFGIRRSDEDKAVEKAISVYEQERKKGRLKRTYSLADIG